MVNISLHTKLMPRAFVGDTTWNVLRMTWRDRSLDECAKSNPPLTISGHPPFWILAGGGLGIVVGLATYGYKCMATVGEKIARLTFTRGFAAQIGTASTVLTATLLGLSVSTTHCLVGSIAGMKLLHRLLVR